MYNAHLTVQLATMGHAQHVIKNISKCRIGGANLVLKAVKVVQLVHQLAQCVKVDISYLTQMQAAYLALHFARFVWLHILVRAVLRDMALSEMIISAINAK